MLGSVRGADAKLMEASNLLQTAVSAATPASPALTAASSSVDFRSMLDQVRVREGGDHNTFFCFCFLYLYSIHNVHYVNYVSFTNYIKHMIYCILFVLTEFIIILYLQHACIYYMIFSIL